LLFENNNLDWNSQLSEGTSVKMGEYLGRF